MEKMGVIVLFTLIHLSLCLSESPQESARIQNCREFLLQWLKPKSVKQSVEYGYPDLGRFSPFQQKQNRSGQKDSTVKIRKRGRKGGVR